MALRRLRRHLPQGGKKSTLLPPWGRFPKGGEGGLAPRFRVGT